MKKSNKNLQKNSNYKDNRYELEGKGLLLFMFGAVSFSIATTASFGYWRWLSAIFIAGAIMTEIITKEKTYDQESV